MHRQRKASLSAHALATIVAATLAACLMLAGFVARSLRPGVPASLPGPEDPDPAWIFGVDPERLAADQRAEPRITYHHEGGERVLTRQEMSELLGSTGLPEDAGQLRVTAIGAEADRKGVIAALASDPALAEWRGKLAVQSYAPDEWPVKDSAFFTGGKPTVYVQQPDGTVLHRQDDFADGAAGLAKALKSASSRAVKPSPGPALRGPKAGYDTKKDADLRKEGVVPRPPDPGPPAPGPEPISPPAPVPLPSPPAVPDWVRQVPLPAWIVAVLGAILAWLGPPPQPEPKKGQ